MNIPITNKIYNCHYRKNENQNSPQINRVAYKLTVMKVSLYNFTKLMQQNKYFSDVGNFAFPQNFHTRKLDQIPVLYAVIAILVIQNY